MVPAGWRRSAWAISSLTRAQLPPPGRTLTTGWLCAPSLTGMGCARCRFCQSTPGCNRRWKRRGLLLPSVIRSAPRWEKIHFSCAAEDCRETQPGRAAAPAPGIGAYSVPSMVPRLNGAAASGIFLPGKSTWTATCSLKKFAWKISASRSTRMASSTGRALPNGACSILPR